MARNRKNQSAAVRFGPALKAFLLCLFIGGSGVGYVWQKKQIFELGEEMKKREQRLEWLQRQNESLSRNLAKLHSHGGLESRVRELNLGLAPPHPEQVVRLAETMPDGPGSADRLYAERRLRSQD